MKGFIEVSPVASKFKRLLNVQWIVESYAYEGKEGNTVITLGLSTPNVGNGYHVLKVVETYEEVCALILAAQ